jgi:hypothetical protein
MAKANQQFQNDTRGLVNLGAALSLVAIIVGVILAISVLAALAPTFFGAVKNLTLAFASPDTGSSLADTILGIIAFIIPLVLVFGLVGLVFYVARKMKLGY